jgi:hypothetical protein
MGLMTGCSSTARTALSASSGTTEDHSSGPAPMPRYLAPADGGARPIASARPGSGRSRFAGHRRRTRLEAREVKAAIRPRDSVQRSSPPRCGKAVENLGCRSAGARWASSGRSGRLYDAWPGVQSLERGTCGKNLGKSANFCSYPKRLSPSRRSYEAAVRLRR